MIDQSHIPTALDVVLHLNARLALVGLPHRVTAISVLPYVNPMWLANWEAPELNDAAEREIIDEELREARWLFPQVRE
jgi:hypothetical protein